MTKTELNLDKIRLKHDLKMELNSKIKQWLLTKDFKITKLNRYERKLSSGDYIYVRLGKHVVTTGLIFTADSVIKTSLTNSIKYSDGYDKITLAILRQIK